MRYRSRAFAVGTKTTYGTHLKSYLHFCETFGYVPVPVTSRVLCRYTAFLAERLRFSSIVQYLNIIRLLHVEHGLSNPLLDNWSLKSLLLGIKRVNGARVCHKEPVTPNLLLQMRGLLNLSNTKDACFWASALVAFFGLFRRSNVFTPSITAFVAGKHLGRSDIRVIDNRLEIIVRWSKTIQCQERELRVPLPHLPGHPLCPVTALLHYFSLTSDAPVNGPAFVVRDASSALQVFSSSMFVTRFRQLLFLLGKQPTHYAIHSFRRGGASWALECGLPADLVRIMGDWRSDAYMSYLDISSESRKLATIKFANCLPTC